MTEARPVAYKAGGTAPTPQLEHGAGSVAKDKKDTPERSLRGRRSSWPLVKEEIQQRLRNTAREALLRQGHQNFLQGLSDWLRNAHPREPPMTAKTISDRLRNDAKIRDLLPKEWKRK
jgi:hypothetical protein